MDACAPHIRVVHDVRMGAQHKGVPILGDEMESIADAAKLYEQYLDLAVVTDLAQLAHPVEQAPFFQQPPAVGLVVLSA